MPGAGKKIFYYAGTAALFVALLLLITVGPQTDADGGRNVLIDQAEVAHIAAMWQSTWQRPPTRAELAAAVNAYVREIILAREALRLGYNENDLTLRRFLSQKMNLLAEAQIENRQFEEAEITAYYALRREQYRQPGQITFRQVFIDNTRDAATAQQRALRWRRQLRAGSLTAAEVGDVSPLPAYLRQQSEQQIRSLFGQSLADSLLFIPLGSWQGPLRSDDGLHLVMVEARTASFIPDWQEIAGRLQYDMLMNEKAAARDRFFSEIAANYRIQYSIADDSLKQVLTR
jgi:hypothetical protein